MGILNPTPGEVADRLTILCLKSDAYSKKRKEIEPIQNEIGLCERFLAQSVYRISYIYTLFDDRAYSEKLRAISGINKILWELEDRIRIKLRERQDYQDNKARVDPSNNIAYLASEIVKANDRRSQLIKEINQLFEIQSEEKIYAE